MKIDGKAIADRILEELRIKVSQLIEKGVVPTLAVVLVGENPASLSYIKQKQKAAERIGATIIVNSQKSKVKSQQLQYLIERYNNNPSIHGIIVQRPLPYTLSDDGAALTNIVLQKDVDGFLPNSPYSVPVARAIITILKEVFSASRITHHALTTKHIVIIGRGETAGKPIADYLTKKGCATSVVHSQTQQPKIIIRNADIVISCVGKERVVTKDMIKPGSILISVGIWRDSEGKLHGDYEEEDIKDVASFYTPTPGGVGPVNVACLMQNLVEAASIGDNRVVVQ